jgi:hypothetical protein
MVGPGRVPRETTRASRDKTMTLDDIATRDDLVILALTPRVRLSGLEWRVVILVRAAPEPITAWELARRLQAAGDVAVVYPHGKRAVRRLVARGLLERSPEGLWFEPKPLALDARTYKPDPVRDRSATRDELMLRTTTTMRPWAR